MSCSLNAIEIDLPQARRAAYRAVGHSSVLVDEGTYDVGTPQGTSSNTMALLSALASGERHAMAAGSPSASFAAVGSAGSNRGMATAAATFQEPVAVTHHHATGHYATGHHAVGRATEAFGGSSSSTALAGRGLRSTWEETATRSSSGAVALGESGGGHAVPLLLSGREYELESRAMFRRRQFGSLQTSWLVKNSFAAWRSVVHLQLAALVREREVLAREEASHLQRLRELQLQLAEKEQLILEWEWRCEQLQYEYERRYLGAARKWRLSASNVLGSQNHTVLDALLRQAFVAFRSACGMARLTRELLDLEEQCQRQVAKLEARNVAVQEEFETRVAALESDWTQRLRNLEATHSSRELDWSGRHRALEDKSSMLLRSRAACAVAAKWALHGGRLLSFIFGAWLRWAHLSRHDASWESRHREQLSSAEREWDESHNKALAKLQREWEERNRRELAKQEQDFEERLRRRVAAIEQDWEERLRASHMDLERQWERRLKSESALLDEDWQAKLREQTAHLEQEWENRQRLKLAALEEDADSKRRRELLSSEQAWEQRKKLELAELQDEFELRLRRERREAEKACDARVRELEASWQERLAEALGGHRRMLKSCGWQAAERKIMGTARVFREAVFKEWKHAWQLRLLQKQAEASDRARAAHVDAEAGARRALALELSRLRDAARERAAAALAGSTRKGLLGVFLAAWHRHASGERGQREFTSRLGSTEQEWQRREAAWQARERELHARKAEVERLAELELKKRDAALAALRSASATKAAMALSGSSRKGLLGMVLGAWSKHARHERSQREQHKQLTEHQKQLSALEHRCNTRLAEEERAYEEEARLRKAQHDEEMSELRNQTMSRAAMAMFGGTRKGLLVTTFGTWHREVSHERHQRELQRELLTAEERWRGRLDASEEERRQRELQMLQELERHRAFRQANGAKAALALFAGSGRLLALTVLKTWAETAKCNKLEREKERELQGLRQDMLTKLQELDGTLQQHRQMAEMQEQKRRREAAELQRHCASKAAMALFGQRGMAALGMSFGAWRDVTRSSRLRNAHDRELQEWSWKLQQSELLQDGLQRSMGLHLGRARDRSYYLLDRAQLTIVLHRFLQHWHHFVDSEQWRRQLDAASQNAERWAALRRDRLHGLSQQVVGWMGVKALLNSAFGAWSELVRDARHAETQAMLQEERQLAARREGRLEEELATISRIVHLVQWRQEIVSHTTLRGARKDVDTILAKAVFGAWFWQVEVRNSGRVRMRRRDQQLAGWGEKYGEARRSVLWHRMFVLWRLCTKLEIWRQRLVRLTRNNICFMADRALRLRNDLALAFALWSSNAVLQGLDREHGLMGYQASRALSRSQVGKERMIAMVLSRSSQCTLRVMLAQWQGLADQAYGRRERQCRADELLALRARGQRARLWAGMKVWLVHTRLLLYAIIHAWRRRLQDTSATQTFSHLQGVVSSLKQRAANALRMRRDPRALLVPIVAFWRHAVLESRGLREQAMGLAFADALAYEREDYEDLAQAAWMKGILTRWRSFAANVRHTRSVEKLLRSARGGAGLARMDTVLAATQEQRARLLLWEAFARWNLMVDINLWTRQRAMPTPQPGPAAQLFYPLLQAQPCSPRPPSPQRPAASAVVYKSVRLVPAQVCTCGNVFMPDAVYCRKCGIRRPQVAISQPVVQPQQVLQPQPVVSPRMLPVSHAIGWQQQPQAAAALGDASLMPSPRSEAALAPTPTVLLQQRPHIQAFHGGIAKRNASPPARSLSTGRAGQQVNAVSGPPVPSVAALPQAAAWGAASPRNQNALTLLSPRMSHPPSAGLQQQRGSSHAAPAAPAAAQGRLAAAAAQQVDPVVRPLPGMALTAASAFMDSVTPSEPIAGGGPSSLRGGNLLGGDRMASEPPSSAILKPQRLLQEADELSETLDASGVAFSTGRPGSFGASGHASPTSAAAAQGSSTVHLRGLRASAAANGAASDVQARPGTLAASLASSSRRPLLDFGTTPGTSLMAPAYEAPYVPAEPTAFEYGSPTRPIRDVGSPPVRALGGPAPPAGSLLDAALQQPQARSHLPASLLGDAASFKTATPEPVAAQGRHEAAEAAQPSMRLSGLRLGALAKRIAAG
eukprot:TRINITY_DN22727_c0_g1_i1.p1 TRINITY_DN22727_c0_g1~~TRINITY_DN22727_c0_g1_i1.p1  ORF type:complete len:2115 (+),score=590.32 TRINITY_DN22727_c0_g1_i1:62-6406(+)